MPETSASKRRNEARAPPNAPNLARLPPLAREFEGLGAPCGSAACPSKQCVEWQSAGDHLCIESELAFSRWGAATPIAGNSSLERAESVSGGRTISDVGMDSRQASFLRGSTLLFHDA